MADTQYMFNEFNSTEDDKIHITSFDMPYALTPLFFKLLYPTLSRT